MRETKYLDPKASHEKNFFFAENVFSQYFSHFSTPQHPDFRDFAGLGMCPYLLMDAVNLCEAHYHAPNVSSGFQISKQFERQLVFDDRGIFWRSTNACPHSPQVNGHPC